MREKSTVTLNNVWGLLCRYRYLIAMPVFACLVVIKVNGSSVSMFGQYYMSGNAAKSVIYGSLRGIRSDEWMVQTPYYLAQVNSPTPFSVVNPNISTSGQNMIVSYGAPVWDISTLAKPLNWGFLLLGQEYGLAWYWNMKILLMLLLSYELCMILTRRCRGVSVLGAFWVTFSPAVQWWFMQHVGDIVFYLEAVVVLFYYCLRYFSSLPRKIPLVLLLSLSCVGFVLTIYPAIQIPLFYLGLMLCVLIALDFRGKIHFGRLDWFLTGGMVLVTCGILAHTLWISRDAVLAVLHTAYPGHRVSSGGEGIAYSINEFLTNIFLPYKDISPSISNDCEISSFYNFLPAVLLAFPVLFRRKATNLKYGVALSVFSVLSLAYLYLKIPVWLARITLLSYVTSRISVAYGIAAVYLSVWALAELSRQSGVGRIYGLAVSLAVGATYLLTVRYTAIRGYVRLRYYLVFILMLMLLNYLMLRGKKKSFSLLMAAVIGISGFTVNPVNIGTGNMFQNDLTVKVRQIRSDDPEACWISLENSTMGAYLYAVGVKDLDGINYYPDMAKWEIIDPDGSFTDEYNRYAHITFSLSSAVPPHENPSPDAISVRLKTSMLQKLKVGYVLTSQKMEPFDDSVATFQLRTPKALNGYYIYYVKYAG